MFLPLNPAGTPENQAGAIRHVCKRDFQTLVQNLQLQDFIKFATYVHKVK